MQDDSEILAFIRKEGISESILAKRANVSQATVSRAITGSAKRHGAARARLFTYIHNEGSGAPPKKGVQSVMAAFEQIWDQSEEHASAVARIIGALEGLAPVSKKRG